MDSFLSNTAMAKQEILKFWSDGQPHSVAQFRAHVQNNGMSDIRKTHIGSATQTALEQGVLNRLGRGMYIAGPNFSTEQIIGSIDTKGSAVRNILQRTLYILSQPINVMELSQKESEILPKLQEFHRNCSQWLEELNKEEEDDISEQGDR